MSHRSDDLYLVDMIEASESIERIRHTKNRDTFDHDEAFRSAVLWNLYIIAEAASKLSMPTRDRFTGIPWDEVRGLRNRLAHGYFTLERDRLWEIVTVNLSVLKLEAESILADGFPAVHRELERRRREGNSDP
jgi:hypothetical protein